VENGRYLLVLQEGQELEKVKACKLEGLQIKQLNSILLELDYSSCKKHFSFSV
jgi:hypothetical protein